MKLTDSPYVAEIQSRSVEYIARSPGYVYVLCPYHPDKNPSLSISATSGDFRCWGCGERGSFFRLIATWDGTTEKEARATADLAPPAFLAYQALERYFGEELSKERHFSVQSFCETFPSAHESEAAVRYLAGRGLSEPLIDRFGLRWGTHGVYRDRVIIPIVNTAGKIESYAARTVNPNVMPKTRKPRRANDTLFGLRNLIQEREMWPYIVVVEGEPDCMYLQQFGVPAVAAMGTAGLSDEQVALLVRHSQCAVLSYDGDVAGMKAMFGRNNEKKHLTIRGDLDKIRVHMPAIAVVLPSGKDPNELTVEQVAKYYGKYVA